MVINEDYTIAFFILSCIFLRLHSYWDKIAVPVERIKDFEQIIDIIKKVLNNIDNSVPIQNFIDTLNKLIVVFESKLNIDNLLNS